MVNCCACRGVISKLEPTHASIHDRSVTSCGAFSLPHVCELTVQFLRADDVESRLCHALMPCQGLGVYSNRARRKMVRSTVDLNASSPCLKDFAYGGIAMTLFRFQEDFAMKVATCTEGA